MQEKKQFWFIAIFLALITLTVFSPLFWHDFVNFDDPLYVTDNLFVRNGISWHGIIWAFRTGEGGNWNPLTWLSHMLDCQLFGLSAAGHHFTNLALHIANTILLFSFLKLATGSMRKSAFVAALFAIHPMHVESVAWIAERKDVLSTFFMLLGLRFYFFYARSDVEISPNANSAKRNYFLTLLFFVCGLMSKPMLVTFPCVLLLLDVWPLKRISLAQFDGKKLVALLREKIPFFALVILFSIITFYAQKGSGAVSSLTSISFSQRIANALISYWRYVAKLFWPTDLSVLYPLQTWSLGQGILAGLFVLSVSVVALLTIRRRPYFAVGWFWFLGTLVPVIGLVQVGTQSMADRYTYIPFIGLFIVLVWSASELLAKFPAQIKTAAAALAIFLCAIGTSIELPHWRDSRALFEQAIAVTRGNSTIYTNLGQAYASVGQFDKALPNFLTALKLRPNAEAYRNVGSVFADNNQIDRAMEFYRESLRLNPNYAKSHYSLAKILIKKGDSTDAIAHLKQAVKTEPELTTAQFTLGLELAKQGNFAEAIEHYRAALELDPNNNETHYNLANALFRRGDVAEAIFEYRTALMNNPRDAESHNNLASALRQQKNFPEAEAHFTEAIRLKPDFADARFNLALLFISETKVAEAAAQLAEVTRLQPDNERAHYQFGALLAAAHSTELAIHHLRETLRVKPDSADALNLLARILSTSNDEKFRDGNESLKLAERACAISQHRNIFHLDTLAAALAEQKDFAGAIEIAEKAKLLAVSQPNILNLIETHLELFKAGKPLRE